MALEFDPELLSISAALTRERALDSLLRAGLPGGKEAELLVLADHVTRVDVVAGAAVRLRICRHQREHSEGRVTLALPRDVGIASRLLALLSPLPARVALSDHVATSDCDGFALVPATLITDREDALLAGDFALEACDRSGVAENRANLVALTVVELAFNAISHATGNVHPPVVAATVANGQGFIEIAAVDLGRDLSEATDVVELVRRIPWAKDGNGFLADLLRRSTKLGVESSIEILAGVARLRWTPFRHRSERINYVPGTTVVVRIGP